MTESPHSIKTAAEAAEAHTDAYAYIQAFFDAGITDPQRISDLAWAGEAYLAKRLTPAAPPPDGLLTPAAAARKPRKPRKPSISKMIAQAEKAGKPVTSITTPDGMTLRFGEPEPGALENPWFADLDKAKQQ